MRRGIASLVGLVAATIVLVSCGEDARRGTLPTGPAGPSGRQSDITPPGTCTTLANLVALTHTVFDDGSPNVNSVLGKLNALNQDASGRRSRRRASRCADDHIIRTTEGGTGHPHRDTRAGPGAPEWCVVLRRSLARYVPHSPE